MVNNMDIQVVTQQTEQHDQVCIENLEYLSRIDCSYRSDLLQPGAFFDIACGNDVTSTDHSNLTPSIEQTDSQNMFDSSDDCTEDDLSGIFLASILNGPAHDRIITYREHKEQMCALNDKWECELDRTIRQSEELLYEQAKVAEEYDQKLSGDSWLKEAFDQARTKEKESQRTEAQLREQYRELKLRLDNEMHERNLCNKRLQLLESTMEEMKVTQSKIRETNAKTTSDVKDAMRKGFLRELSDVLESDSIVIKDSSEDKVSNANNTINVGKEIRTLLSKYQTISRIEMKHVLLEQKTAMQEEIASQILQHEKHFKLEKDKLVATHEAKIEQLSSDALNDRGLLILEMRRAFDDFKAREEEPKPILLCLKEICRNLYVG